MLKNIKFFLYTALLTTTATLYFSGFTVYETEHAVRISSLPLQSQNRQRQFIQTPGFYFKIPFWTKIIKWNKNIQYTVCRSMLFPALQADTILVDIGITWRVTNADLYSLFIEKFYLQTNDLLKKWLNDGLKEEWLHNELSPIIQSDVAEVLKKYLIQQARIKGIEIIDCYIIQKTPTVAFKQSILQEMKLNQEQSAKRMLRESQKNAHAVQVHASSQKAIALARINTKVEKIKQEGELIANQLYTEAYKKNPQFASIYQRLRSYERSAIDKKPSKMVININDRLPT